MNDNLAPGESLLNGDCRITGDAVCLACGNHWAAAEPVGTVDLECPRCSLLRGVFAIPIGPADGMTWVCLCGNDQFRLLGAPDSATYSVMCAKCGREHGGWWWQTG